MKHYNEYGFIKIDKFLNKDELSNLREVANAFHKSWTLSNCEFYNTKAVNSAYLTGQRHLDHNSRQSLFKFIGSATFSDLAQQIFGKTPAFMNTQLFFNPVRKSQKNYWHRDTQYHLSEVEQQKALTGPKVIHFRLALKDELGIELIPRSHIQWDTAQELNVRLEQNKRRNYEDLASGESIPLMAGDLLVFSANLIHRGLYGMDRRALDILLCDPVPELLSLIEASCLPNETDLSKLDCPDIFINSVAKNEL